MPCEALHQEILVAVLEYALSHFQWVVQGNFCLATASQDDHIKKNDIGDGPIA